MTILYDERPITRIHLMDCSYQVGFSGVEKIRPYEEPGEMAAVTWYEIWTHRGLDSRINGKYVVSVGYDPVPDDEDVPF